MEILKRFKDIMSANVNALLDKAEDPEKMVDQYLRNIKQDLNNVTAQTAAVMAEEKRAKRALDENQAEIEKLTEYAEKAVLAGNDADAQAFLTKKAPLAAKQGTLQTQYELAAANAEKMKQMHEKLVNDVKTLEGRQAEIKAKMQMAKTQEKINAMTSAIPDSSTNISAFERMEEKANRMLDEAEAKSELTAPLADTTEDIMAKYDDEKQDAAIAEELAAMKAKLGV